MLRIHQFGNLEAWITTIQILGIYCKNQPQTNLKHATQNNKLSRKLSTVYSAEIYRTAQLNQHEWHIGTQGCIGILEQIKMSNINQFVCQVN